MLGFHIFDLSISRSIKMHFYGATRRE